MMGSQIVVDHPELDHNGLLLIPPSSNSSHAMKELLAEIKSLTLRSKSRACEASKITESADGLDQHMLRLESRVLRDRAQKLDKQLSDLVTGELGRSEQ
jgi:hypothetical protein